MLLDAPIAKRWGELVDAHPPLWRRGGEPIRAGSRQTTAEVIDRIASPVFSNE